MSGIASDPALVYRPRNVNYSRPAVRDCRAWAEQATHTRNAHVAPTEGKLRQAGNCHYDHDDNEEDDDDTASDDDKDSEFDDGEDQDDSYTIRLHARSSIDSTYASSETSARSNVAPNQTRAEKHIVYLHRRPATTGTTLKVSEQRYDPRAGNLDPTTAANAPCPRPAAFYPPRPVSLASTYRPVSRLSTTSTASSDTITPASYRRNTRLSAADLKPIDLTRTISSTVSSASAPAATPHLAAARPLSTSHSARTSIQPLSPAFPPAIRPSPRTPAVIMFTNDFEDEAQGDHNGREDGASGGAGTAGAGERPWQISDCDYSGLSEKQVQKLRKKGINPALYVEMQAARKKAGKIGILSGNTYLN